MAVRPQKCRLGGEARRALELLLDEHGTTEALMLALGFTSRMLARMARAGLVTIRHQVIKVIKAGDKPLEVSRIRITDAGRRAIDQPVQTAASRARYRDAPTAVAKTISR